jgi:hypothetical protein
MARLVAQRDQARTHVDELEAEQREATAAAQQASDALIELERKGGRPGAQRSKLEQTLAEARAKAAEPWAERIAGTRAAVRDAHGEVQTFVAEYLAELIADLEVEGAAAAAKLTAAAETLLQAFTDRERVAREIAEMCSLVARVSPGDVSYSRAEALARAAGDLLQAAARSRRCSGVTRASRGTAYWRTQAPHEGRRVHGWAPRQGRA